MSWVEETLVDAFLGEGIGEVAADSTAAPEPVQLGWEFDRSSCLYFHKSLGTHFAEEGGVFYDDSEQKYYYFDMLSMRHEEMQEEQLELVRQCAMNAGLKLPGLTGADVECPEAAALASSGAVEPQETAGNQSTSKELECTWHRAWEEWVDGHEATTLLGLRFFAACSTTPGIWACSTSNGQLFRHGRDGYEVVGFPVLRVRGLGRDDDDYHEEVELFACDTVLGSGEGATLKYDRSSSGLLDRHSSIRFNPAAERWQVRDPAAGLGSHVDGSPLLHDDWMTLEPPPGGRMMLNVGSMRLQLSFGEKKSCPHAPSEAAVGSGMVGNVVSASFEINPALLPEPPLSREARMEFDNRLRRKAANRMSTSDREANAARVAEYADRAEHRRQTRLEWDDAAAAEQARAASAAEDEIEEQASIGLQEACMAADGSFVGTSQPRHAGLGYREPADDATESKEQKRRRITEHRYREASAS